MTTTWIELLEDQIPADMAHEINLFESQIALKQQGKLDEKVFAETRLRKGAYGQRYDNGTRHDGIQTQTLAFPQAESKGVDTVWHAPGMQRIKVPFGGLSPLQLDTLAQLAEEYADGILHITTRQDFQFHFVHIEDTPDLMRRLAAVGITTQEACGNSIRNITACPLAGVCHTEAFDVSPYAKALAFFLLNHDDVQDFGRKFKTAFSGCEHEACGLVKMHDLGLLARTKVVDGQVKRGFTAYVGGGLGTIPYQAKILSDFVPEEELLPLAQSIARVFARYGEKKNRNRARIKFLVEKLGLEEFRRLVFEEREVLPYDNRWTDYLKDVPAHPNAPIRPAISLNGHARPTGFDEWAQTNLYPQRQPGYVTITLNIPLGDLSSDQAYHLADIARKYVGDAQQELGHIRTTVEQNIVLRFVSEADLPDIYRELKAIGLGEPGAGTIVDITSCPGTDTCKLGIASSRGLAGELRTRLAVQNATLPDAVKNLRIKISGCFNSCGQHHVADIGFFGNSRRRDNRTVPHFQVVLGGRWRENAGSYGLAVGAVPSKSVPDVLDTLTNRYVQERTSEESFQDWVTRVGRKGIKDLLTPFTEVPAYDQNPTFYSDWGDPREFTIGDMGVGECAGEIVSLFSFEIAKAEGEHFDALLALDEANYPLAEQRAYKAMLLAAKALVRNQFLDVGDQPDRIVSQFRTRFYDTELFFDKYAKGKFARFLLDYHETPNPTPNFDSAHKLVGEAQLFIEAAHACDARLAGATMGGVNL